MKYIDSICTLNKVSLIESFKVTTLNLVLYTKDSNLSNGGTKPLFDKNINNTAPNDVHIIEQNNPNDTSNILSIEILGIIAYRILQLFKLMIFHYSHCDSQCDKMTF